MTKKDELMTILNTYSISGYENNLIEIFEKKVKSKIENSTFIKDKLGSSFYFHKSNNPNAKTLMIDAHADEIGFVVGSIQENGLIKVEPRGGIALKYAIGQRMKLITFDGKQIPGILIDDINPKHSLANKTNTLSIDDMFFDVGALSINEIRKMNIEIGNGVYFDAFPEINGDILVARAIDNKVGVALIFQLIDFISEQKNLDYNIAIGLSVQEEVGLRGARTIAHKINPDIAMIIDISPSKDFPVDLSEGTIGKGTMLRHFDGVTLTPRKVILFLENILKVNKIDYQDFHRVVGGTNAGIIHLVKNGILVIPIGLLARHLHTSSSICSLRDIENTFMLCSKIILELNTQKIISLIEKK